MEKRRPHYDLKLIQAQMACIEAMNLTMTARHGIKAIAMALGGALVVIQRLSMGNFYKAMTVHADSRVWQDVYHAECKEGPCTSSFNNTRNSLSCRSRSVDHE